MSKNTLKNIFSLACLLCLVLAGGETQDGSMNPAWTFPWLGASIIFGILLNVVTKEEKKGK